MFQDLGVDVEYDLLHDVAAVVAHAFDLAQHQQRLQGAYGTRGILLDEVGQNVDRIVIDRVDRRILSEDLAGQPRVLRLEGHEALREHRDDGVEHGGHLQLLLQRVGRLFAVARDDVAGDAVGKVGDAFERAADLDERQHQPQVDSYGAEEGDVVLAVAVDLQFEGIDPLLAAAHFTGQLGVVGQVGLFHFFELGEHQPPHLADGIADERQLLFGVFHGLCGIGRTANRIVR